jgi:hypothetical protein
MKKKNGNQTTPKNEKPVVKLKSIDPSMVIDNKAAELAAQKVGLDIEAITSKDIPPMDKTDLPEAIPMNWKPRNAYVVLKAVIKEDVITGEKKDKYMHDDFDFVVDAVGSTVKGLKVGDEIFVQYPYLNYINEDNMRWHSTRVRYFYVNELDIRLVK